MKTLAKMLYGNSGSIVDAIDRYIAKADDDLSKQLKKEGFARPKETVKAITAFEEEIAGILGEQTAAFLAVLGASATMDELQQAIETMLVDDTIKEQITEAVQGMFEKQIPQLTNSYIKTYEKDMAIEVLRKRTDGWMQEWSDQLGRLVEETSHRLINSIVEETVASGGSVEDMTRIILEGGWRNEYYQAKRLSLTEMLRAHSVAREEAIQQSPATNRKEWKHTGAHKNNPRLNHVDMDGQIVDKDKTFELIGADGSTYHPLYPRDSSLPVGEVANCHCIHRGIVNDDILGMSLEDRKALQQAIIEADDEEWKKELDRKNKAKAGIDG